MTICEFCSFFQLYLTGLLKPGTQKKRPATLVSGHEKHICFHQPAFVEVSAWRCFHPFCSNKVSKVIHRSYWFPLIACIESQQRNVTNSQLVTAYRQLSCGERWWYAFRYIYDRILLDTSPFLTGGAVWAHLGFRVVCILIDLSLYLITLSSGIIMIFKKCTLYIYFTNYTYIIMHATPSACFLNIR